LEFDAGPTVATIFVLLNDTYISISKMKKFILTVFIARKIT